MNTTPKNNHLRIGLFGLIGVALVVSVVLLSQVISPNHESVFNGERALQDVAYQVALGPRTAGSEAHAQFITWLQAELEATGWQVEIQTATRMDHDIKNVIASRSDEPPEIILAAHYDSRLFADQDPDPALRQESVPGANDGASGVALLLELSRVLPSDSVPVWLVFFDAEDNGDIPGWDWILGSRAFVDTLTEEPSAVIILDMLGDVVLDIYFERNSDPLLSQEIWSQADRLGYGDYFIQEVKYSILDDHIPFVEAGIPAVDIIDFDYPYWHTTADTIDKVSMQSLQHVGETLLAWIVNKP